LRPNIAITGPTAAGKTTHALLLSTALGYDYVSASEVLLHKVGLSKGNNDRWVTDMEQIEAQRSDGAADRAVDDELLARAARSEGTVFDSWFLPYLYDNTQPLLRIYLTSDLESRTLKCRVSQEPKGTKLPLDECRALITRKDETSAAHARELYDVDIHDTASFDHVADNSGLIYEPTIESARSGIRAFHSTLLTAVRNQLVRYGGELTQPRLVELAGCIVQNDAGDILLLHRNRGGTTQWEIPGGKVEPGEDARTAAKRELLEEVGVDAVIGDELGTRDFSEFGIGYRYTWLVATITNGIPQLREPETFDGLRHFSLDDLRLAYVDRSLSPNAANFYEELVAGRVALRVAMEGGT
jgi:mutator protein MutT